MAFKLFKFVIAGLGTLLAWYCIYSVYTIYGAVLRQLQEALWLSLDTGPYILGFSIGLIMASWGLRAMWGDRGKRIKKEKKLAKKEKKRLKKEARRQAKNKSS